LTILLLLGVVVAEPTMAAVAVLAGLEQGH
jgi:hypothetical protein